MISYLKVPHHQILPDLDPKLAAFKKLLSTLLLPSPVALASWLHAHLSVASCCRR
jgi:hypothetical protein